jgi:hypothetical protein
MVRGLDSNPFLDRPFAMIKSSPATDTFHVAALQSGARVHVRLSSKKIRQ